MEQNRLLQNFYDEIYDEERNFADDDTPQFENETDDVDADVVDADIDNEDEQQDFTIDDDDPNRDEDAEEPDSDDEPLITQRIPRKQKFGSQSGVCNAENYDKVLEQLAEKYVWSNKAGERMEWDTVKPTTVTNPNRAGRRSAKDLPLPEGPTRFARARLARANATSPAATWSLMITDDMLLEAVNYTNVKITKIFALLGDQLTEKDKNTQYRLTSLLEVKAWFGLLYIRGALKLNGMHVDSVWYHESSHDLFSSTMQRKRFTFLTHLIQFVDSETREERWKEDKFAPFRKFFEGVNRRFLATRKPSAHLAIDETLHPYRGRIGFVQYNPNKPSKVSSSEVFVIQHCNTHIFPYRMQENRRVGQMIIT